MLDTETRSTKRKLATDCRAKRVSVSAGQGDVHSIELLRGQSWKRRLRLALDDDDDDNVCNVRKLRNLFY